MKLDGAVLRSRADDILNTISNPNLLGKLIEVKTLPKDERIKAAAQKLTLSALKKAGIKTPEGIRISNCYFEEEVELSFQLDDSKDRSSIVSATRELEPAFISQLRERDPNLYDQIVMHLRSVHGELSYSMSLCSSVGTWLGIGSGRVGNKLKRNPTSADITRLHGECKLGYDEIIQFVTTPEFNSVYNELMDLPLNDMPKFVVDVLLNDVELQNRGVNRPNNFFIMRTSFGDRRPTLFCVKKWLPRDLLVFWENINITFGIDFKEDVLDNASAWRSPVPVAIQHEYLSGRLTKENVDEVVDALDLMTELTF